MFRRLAVFAALVVASVGSVRADFVFSPLGNAGGAGSIPNAIGFDYSAGNVLGLGGNTAVANFLANLGDGGSRNVNFSGFGQANLSAVNRSIAPTPVSILPVFPATGPGFAAVVGLSETVIGATGVPGSGTALFGLNAAGPVNYFEIYAVPNLGNNLAGTGFNSPTRILAGTITALNTLSALTTSTTPTSALDQAGSNNYAGLDTLPGGGQIRVLGNVTSYDSNYFVTNPGFVLDTFVFDAQLSSPFLNVDPSAQFLINSLLTALGQAPAPAGAGSGGLGTVNLASPSGPGGPDTQFQAIGNISITTRFVPNDREVPEPISIASFAFALSAGIVAVRRRLKA